MSRLCLYYIQQPEKDRFLPGDRHIRRVIRRILRGAPRVGGVDKVFINLCLGLDKLGINYDVNLPFKYLEKGDRVGILGRGRDCLNGYNKSNPIVAGIGLMTHPSEWPSLCQDYPVAKYLQHSQWAFDIYKPYFNERCGIWPVGIDTDTWQPADTLPKSVDFLIYNKVACKWNHEEYELNLLAPIRQLLQQHKLTFEEIHYGKYNPKDYQQALSRCRAMIFLSEHESQGIAYQECLSSGVPILAWDQGKFLDQNRFKWGTPDIAATSVPFWDERCGVKFKNTSELPTKLEEFLDKLNEQKFAPRNYILENLTLEKCAKNFVEILDQVNSNHS